jgi:hypothetical protein
VARLHFYSVVIPHGGLYWRITLPLGPVGRRCVDFKSKKRAQAFYQAAKKELKRTKRIDFLTSGHKLIDAIEALRALEGVDKGPWQNRLRRAAALYALCEGELSKEAGGFSEPSSRAVELPSGLYRGLVGLARTKGCDLSDLVVSLLWQYLRGESEKRIKTYPNEEKIPLRCLL